MRSYRSEVGESESAFQTEEGTVYLLASKVAHQFPHLALLGQPQLDGNTLVALADLGHELINICWRGTAGSSRP
jgi:hypothetical protein